MTDPSARTRRRFLANLTATSSAAVLGPSAFGQGAGRASSVPEPPREFRGAWVASVHNIDWPKNRGASAAAQQAELRGLMDHAAAANLNTIVFQVRPGADALYESRLEPWSYWLTGTEGRSPGWDPLAFAVNEAHARGLELHAWFNPFRASGSSRITHSSDHVSKRHSGWVQRYNGLLWLDPGRPEVRRHSIGVITDVAKRYDIDGIHLDDYFYPYPAKHAPGQVPYPFFDDNASFSAHGRGDRADWRRANIHAFVRDLYGAVKAVRTSVKCGISPFGIWRPGTPSGISAGLDSFAHLYADSRQWLREGWVDYFSPQLYWRISPEAQSFTKLLHWWDSENRKGRFVWPGMGTSRIKSSDDPGRPASEIIAQIKAIRARMDRTAPGHIHWSFSALRADRGGINRLLATEVYQSKALVPPTPWLGRGKPAPPAARHLGDGKIAWAKVEGARWYSVQTLAGSDWGLAAVLPASATGIALTHQARAVAVRAVAPAGALSDPGVVPLS